MDTTPLNGAAIDVAARIGWLARMARHLRGGPGLRRLEDMSRATGFSVARLQRVETGGQRNGDVLAAYERVLDLPAGSLVAPVDVMCRTFPRISPRELGRRSPVSDVVELSSMTERLLDDTVEVDGGTWLAWARAMSTAGGIGLPAPLARQLIVRLIDEMSRATSSGYVARYEALAHLRCGPYGAMVLGMAQQWVRDPDTQAVGDLASAIGEADSPDAMAWFVELLDEDRDRLVVAGALGLEEMAAITDDPSFWDRLLPHLIDSINAAAEGSARWHWTTHLLRLVPSETWRLHRVRPERRLAPRPDVRDWSRSRTNAHWTECRERSAAIAGRLGQVSPGMLARLMFDLAVSPHETRAVTTYMLLGGLPELAHNVGTELAAMAEELADDVLRARIARRLPGVLPATLPDRVRDWATSPVPELRWCAMYAAGAAGVHLSSEVLNVETLRDAFPSAALYSAGMSGHPILGAWSHHERPEVVGAVGWWLRHGSRVVL